MSECFDTASSAEEDVLEIDRFVQAHEEGNSDAADIAESMDSNSM